MKKYKDYLIFTTLFVAMIFGSITLAEAETAEDQDQIILPISSPTASVSATATTSVSASASVSVDSRKFTNLLVVVTNKKNDRILGGVTIDIDNVQHKTSDPPPLNGYEIKNFVTGEHSITVKRNGYEILSETKTISAEGEYTKMEIKLTPLVGTPEIDESDVENYFSNYNNSIGSNSVYNPFYSNNGYNQYSASGDLGSSTYTGYPLPQINYSNSTQSYTVPVKIRLNANGYSFGGNELTQVQIIDQSRNTIELSNVINGNFYSNGDQYYRLGCLQPNTQYTFVIKNVNNSSLSPSYFNFATNKTGSYFVDITVNAAAFYSNSSLSSSSNPISANARPLSELGTNFYCPSSMGGNLINFPNSLLDSSNILSSGNNIQIWNGGSISLSNYKINLSPVDGNYYLINKNNSFDTRKLYFVDRGDNKGGLVFIPTQSTGVGNELSQSSAKNWYISTYTRSSEGELTLGSDVYPSSLSPSQYAKALNKEIINAFSSSSKNSSATSLDTSSGTSLGDNCLKKDNQLFCLSGENIVSKYKNGDLNRRIEKIADTINANINKTKDKKGSPFLNIIADNSNFDGYFGTSAIAVTCPAQIGTEVLATGTAEKCLNLLKATIGAEQYSQLFRSSSRDITFMAYRSESRNGQDLDDNLLVTTTNHEWAHVYDFQSDEKSSYKTISENPNYLFKSFFELTAETAQSQAKSGNIVGKEFPLELNDAVTKEYPLCVYFGFETAPVLALNSTDEINFIFQGNPYTSASELFAYSFQIYKENTLTKINDIFSKGNANSQCASSTTKLVNEQKEIFN